MIRRPPRSTQGVSSAASDVYKRQYQRRVHGEGYDISDVYATSSFDSKKNKITVHLMWIQGKGFNSKQAIYIKSQDNGIHWSEEYPIGENVGLLSQEFPYPSQRILAHPAFPQSLLYTGYSYDESKREYSQVFFRHSEDNGNTWSSPIYLSSKKVVSDIFINYQNVLSAEIYSKDNKPTLVFFAHPDLDTLEFGSVDLETFRLTHESHPFPEGSKERQNVAFSPKLISKTPIIVAKGSKLLMAFYSQSSGDCLLYTSPSPRDLSTSRMPSSA
eukprot:TRINITY_DN1136_c0_g1_i4.p1 TRINITY_DN1136_c0_g1~~TRINITY_DN1136_c0_g1_i4.p1  ORF type:complete len:272 (+),score=56.20 TRINITY_DN1136_c0_g1_i4:117-932(+)